MVSNALPLLLQAFKRASISTILQTLLIVHIRKVALVEMYHQDKSG